MILVTGATGFLGSEVCRQLILGGKNSIEKLKTDKIAFPQTYLIGTDFVLKTISLFSKAL